MMNEYWLPIPDCPGYEVSDHGRVKSLARVVLRLTRSGTVSKHTVRERILKPGTWSGYPLVAVHVGKEQRTFTIHQLVMQVFGPPRPSPKHMARHLDDNRSNCILSNLAWGTQADNMADAKRNGRVLGGYRPKGSKVGAGV